MVSKPKIRDDRIYELTGYIRDYLKSFDTDIVRTCMTCMYFNEHSGETCQRNLALGRPPARIIAFGCGDYFNEDEIPF